MKRKIICLVAILSLLMAGLGVAMTLTASASDLIPTEPVATISEADIPSETTFPEPTEPEEVVIVLDTVVVERVEPTTYDEANSLLDETTKCQETAQMVLDGLIELGYEPDHPAIVMAYAELENRTADVAYYQEKQVEWEEIHKWEVRASEYPIATQVWLYMKEEFGWSDTVCAGIMGNMMAECGGCWTSDLDWDVSSSSGYGMIHMVVFFISLNVLWLGIWQWWAKRLIGMKWRWAALDTMPFLGFTIGILALTWWITLPIENLWCLMLSRMAIAALLYGGIMWISGAKIMRETIGYLLHKKK